MQRTALQGMVESGTWGRGNGGGREEGSLSQAGRGFEHMALLLEILLVIWEDVSREMAVALQGRSLGCQHAG